ncbi:hypothetical protein [uncultured Gammaproteobacteria bacterium]|nr:hypothetical protein [uncultured Gammaproteobacteria bacterium]
MSRPLKTHSNQTKPNQTKPNQTKPNQTKTTHFANHLNQTKLLFIQQHKKP